MRVPPEFERYHKRLLGPEYDSFMDYFSKRPTRWSVRVNTLKSSMREVKRVLAENNIGFGHTAWCRDGLWVDSQDLNLMEHQLGLYYIQSAASMVPPLVLGAGERILDLAAAPGGKSTHLAQLMGNRGTLVANDDSAPRMKALVYNLQRCGVRNVVVTRHDGVKFNGLGERFDRVMVDAPCSSVGTLRHSREVLRKWTREWVKKLAAVQKKMVLSGFDCLSPGGRLVYSTCTTSTQENEEVIEDLLRERRDASLVKVKVEGLKLRRGLTDDTADCARVYPQDNGCDPYFIALVEKNG